MEVFVQYADRFSDQAEVTGGLEDFIERGEGPGTRFEPEGEFAPRDSKRAKLAWSSSSAKNAAFPVGAIVRHPQFGEGEIVTITAGANARATIRFRGVGTKTLVLEYARLTRVR